MPTRTSTATLAPAVLRLTVEFVLKLIGDGYTADDIVREYPELEKDDVFQAAKYGAWLASERTSSVA